MIRKAVVGLMVVAALLIIWSLTRKNTAPEVRFVRVKRETMSSSIQTNGKVEPIEWASARVTIPGTVDSVFVQRGQTVREGDPLVSLDAQQAEAALAGAEARIDQAKAEQKLLTEGGRPAEISDLENRLERAKLDLAVARKDADALQRLFAKRAATSKEASDALELVRQDELQVRSLQERRANLIAPADLNVAGARLREAEAAAAVARENLALSTIRSPMGGTVYQFDIHPGMYLGVGELVANVGRLDQVRVIVYVDEPDLGRVKKNEQVTIIWDAMPGRQWLGRVDKPATQVVALGSRQVGEVGSIVENPHHDLLPGTNIDATIQAAVVEGALTIPKEAVRRQNEQTGVLLLKGDRVVWRPVELGEATLMRTQVKSGLSDGDEVAGPTDTPLADGTKVKAVLGP